MLQKTLNIVCYVYAVNVFIAFVFAVSPQMWLDYIQLFPNYLLSAFCFILCTNKMHLQYKFWWLSLYSDMFQHDDFTFRKYTSSL